MHAPATTVFRVACVGVVDQGCMDPFGGCGWRSYRAFSPASQTGGPAWVARRARHCPSCAGHVVPLWPVGSSPGRSRDRVYLLHFEPAFGHARHYLGWTDDLPARLRAHRGGNGANLVAHAVAAGCQIILVRYWVGDRGLEATFKQRRLRPSPRTRNGRRLGAARSLAEFCPICNPGRAAKRRPLHTA